MSTKHNIPQTVSNEPTRRQFLKALAIIPAAALPALQTLGNSKVEPPTLEPPTQDPIPQTAEALIKRLLDLSIIMAAEPARFGAWLKGDKLQDPVKVLRLFDEAEAAAEEYQRLMFSQEFDQLVLAPLCGGPERYAEILSNWQEPAEATGPEALKGAAYLDIATVAIELAAKA